MSEAAPRSAVHSYSLCRRLPEWRAEGSHPRWLSHNVGKLRVRVQAVQFSAGRRLALVFVFDAVGASEFGADEGFPAHVGEVGVVVETGDDMASEFRGFGFVKDVAEFGGV